jgi:hypothetical protein
MKRVLALLLLLCAVAAPAQAFEYVSRLAPARLDGATSIDGGLLAQRVIDREWGLSEDSTYREVEVEDWKSEGLALALSGAVPGAGHLYVGESSGWLYLAAEALLWVGRGVLRQQASDLRSQAVAFLGDPTDTSSVWAFQRYEDRSGQSATDLEALWNLDRDAYYQALSRDTGWLAGFTGVDPSIAYQSYVSLRSEQQQRLQRARQVDLLLVAYHVYAAWDALRAAHAHNLPARRNLEIQVGSVLERGRPGVRAAVVGRF